MITEQYKELIGYVAACNGTGKMELDQKIAAGEITKEDAQLVFYYATIQKLRNRLDNVSDRIKNIHPRFTFPEV
jgi:hypothetical protein